MTTPLQHTASASHLLANAAVHLCAAEPDAPQGVRVALTRLATRLTRCNLALHRIERRIRRVQASSLR